MTDHREGDEVWVRARYVTNDSGLRNLHVALCDWGGKTVLLWVKSSDVISVTSVPTESELVDKANMVDAARAALSSVAEQMTEHAYQELASALESLPRFESPEKKP